MSSNYLDEDNAGEFRDVPEEAGGEPSSQAVVDVQSTRRVLPSAPAPVPQKSQNQQEEDEYWEHVSGGDSEATEEAEEDYSEVLSDARLRLEQGRLYELVMNSDLFNGSDCDPKAIKNVEREIRNFARERMEIMLGMRQEASKEAAFPLEAFPFNALEVEVLKSLASAATQGASKEAEPFTSPAKSRKNTLNPIVVRGNRPQQKQASKPLPTKPTAPVKRPKVSESVQRILEEEGLTLDQVNEVFDPNKKYLTPEELASLTAEQIIERNKQANTRVGKSAKSAGAIPMPGQEHIDAIYTRRASEASANPQMQMIMGLLDKKNQPK